MTVDDIGFVLIMLSAILLLILILRRILWWYLGIDKHLANQQTIIDLLTKQMELEQIVQNQNAKRRVETTQPASQSHQSQSPTRRPSSSQP